MLTIRGDYVENVVIYTIHARKTNWVLVLVIGLVGGLGLFLLGMKMLSDGMQQAALFNQRWNGNNQYRIEREIQTISKPCHRNGAASL